MSALTPLQKILTSFRAASVTEREKGTYFEELICVYLRNEPTYADLYSDIWMLADVPAEFGINTTDTGIDLHDLETSQIDWSKYQPDTEVGKKRKADDDVVQTFHFEPCRYQRVRTSLS